MSLGKQQWSIPLRRRAVSRQAGTGQPVDAPVCRIERSGNFAGYAVFGWHYNGLGIWHVKVWAASDARPEKTYTVVGNAFYPETIDPAEKFAILHLIAMWEADWVRQADVA